MIKILRNKDFNITDFLVDNVEDVNELKNTNGCAAGSTAYIVSTGETYIKKISGDWVEKIELAVGDNTQDSSSENSTSSVGILIDEVDENGYPTSISLSGMTTIPNSFFREVIVADNYPFGNVTHINFLEGITEIASSVCMQCSNLKSISLPSSLIKIDGQAFMSTSLEKVEIPENVTTINMYGFGEISTLTEVICHSSELSGSSIFSYCSNLAKLVFTNLKSVPKSEFISGTAIASGNGYIYVPDDLVDSFKSDVEWGTYSDQIKSLSELPTE